MGRSLGHCAGVLLVGKDKLVPMELPIYVVDAFTNRPFSGNPAGVCVLNEPISDELMQKIAQEMNHAETAFLLPTSSAWSLRWFTPACEVDLCGHATLASAHLLWSSGRATGELCFDTRSGSLGAVKNEHGIELDFPSEPVVEIPLSQVSEAIGSEKAVFAGSNRMDFLVQLASEAAVRRFIPDMAAIASLGNRALMITAKADADAEYDFISRLFGPNVGIPEDPVTGSAHCALAPFWAERLGKSSMLGYQGSARGGFVGVEVVLERIKLRGRATTTLSGTLHF